MIIDLHPAADRRRFGWSPDGRFALTPLAAQVVRAKYRRLRRHGFSPFSARVMIRELMWCGGAA